MITALSLAANNVITTLTESTTVLVEWLEARIIPMWDTGIAKFVAEKQKQTASIRVFNDGVAAVKSQLYMQEQAGAAAERAVPPANLTSTVTNGAMLGEQAAVVRAKTATNDAAVMGAFYTTKSVDVGAVIERHKPYCSQADLDRGRCDTAVSPTMQNADLMVNTILNPGEGQYETLADDEREAGIAFVKHVVNPVPMNRMPQAGSAQSKAYEAALLADQAAMSLAAHSFNAIIANRTRRHQQ